MGVAFKWKSFGEDLSLDEDILDEIDTNNETDEDCLRDMLERCMMRFDLKHIRDTVLRGINMEEEGQLRRLASYFCYIIGCVLGLYNNWYSNRPWCQQYSVYPFQTLRALSLTGTQLR